MIQYDGIEISNKHDVRDKVLSPLSVTLGEWWTLAYNPDELRRRRAIKTYKIVLSEISRYKTALEDVLPFMVYLEDTVIMRDYIKQIEEQTLRVTNQVAVLREELVLE